MTFTNVIYNILIGPLYLLFEVIFSIAYRVFNHPGICIIFLSLTMNFLVLPLYKRADAMQEEENEIEQKLHRGVEHIKKTFKGDDRMMMLQTYYRQNNYHPLNALKGSVSLLLEIPFFIAAYRFLSELEILSGISFGPITDLSMPDGLICAFGITVNILPIIMTLINVISSAIYTKGYPLKTKVQLYVMALFFLVFLYDSPSGLLFYWTLNNLFSLVKTIFFKLKHASVILCISSSTVGALLIAMAIMRVGNYSFKVYLIEALLGVLLQIPFLWKKLMKDKIPNKVYAPNKRAFVLGCILLTVLIGMLIPSSVIENSTLEFIDNSFFYNPSWYVVNALTLSLGIFLVWFRVFYWLANDFGKTVFEMVIGMVSLCSIINYMFFGKNHGIMNTFMIFDKGLSFGRRDVIANLAVIIFSAALIFILFKVLKNKYEYILLVSSLAVFAMGIVNMYSIRSSVAEYENAKHDSSMPNVTLSTTGKNVVVFMVDRAIGLYVPYIFEEKPELKDIYSGFTYYDNVVSYGAYTNIGTPPIFGGYEYTPEEMNKRDSEGLKYKHNEALLVMPVIFGDNGYNVTLFNPSYANYSWIPDLSIYSDYPDFNVYNTYGLFASKEAKLFSIKSIGRNLFCYSLMKVSPVVLQPTLYNEGAYNSLAHFSENAYTGQVYVDKSTANGLNQDAMDYYNTLSNITNITTITNEESNNYFCMVTELAHDVLLYDENTYSPSISVDNRDYDEAHADRFTYEGVSIKMETPQQMAHYQSNLVAFSLIGEWIEYLKEKGAYDNTKIILVSDHGQGLSQVDKFSLGADSNEFLDIEAYYPILLVKDFGEKDFTISHEFMTNADVPTIAFAGNIDNPINPFTNKPISSELKSNDNVYILGSAGWSVEANDGSVYFADQWLSVHTDMREPDNWTVLYESSISPREQKEWDIELFNEFHGK